MVVGQEPDQTFLAAMRLHAKSRLYIARLNLSEYSPMKPVIPLILSLALLSACDAVPAEKIVTLIADGSPSVAKGDIELRGCELRIKSDSKTPDEAYFVRVLMRAHLSHYNAKRVNIRVRPDGRAILKLDRRPISEGMLAMAKRAVGKAPFGEAGVRDQATVGGATAISDDALRKLFAVPGGQIKFNLRTLVKVGTPPEPHKDGPTFHAFATAVASLPQPTTASLSLQYAGDAPIADRLIAGAVTVLPAALQFATASKDDAADLGQALYDHQQEVCASD